MSQGTWAACTKAYFGEIKDSSEGILNTRRSFMFSIPHQALFG